MNLRKHIVPLLVLFINSIAITIYVSSDITMLGFFTDDTTVGVYGFASKIYNIIKQLVNAVVVVALPRISYILKNKTDMYNQYVDKIFSAVNIILFPIIIGTLFMSKTIIYIAGGWQYLTGDLSLKVLSIATLFAIYASIFTNCVLIVNRQEDKCLKSTVISAIVNVTLNFMLIPSLGMIGAALTTVLAELINCIMQMHYSKLYFDWHQLNFKNIFPCIIGGIAVAAVCMFTNIFIDKAMFRMIISIVISAGLYIIILILFKHE